MSREQRERNDFATQLMKGLLAQSSLSSTVDFHTHLDECEQCRNQPFEMCPTGRELLKKATARGVK